MASNDKYKNTVTMDQKNKQLQKLGDLASGPESDVEASHEGPQFGKPLGQVITVAKTVDNKSFKVYRDDETDEFKPTSMTAIEFLAATPASKPLTYDEKGLLDAVASDLERSLSLENIIGEPPLPTIPEEVQLEIDKLPSWLGAMIAYRYDRIKAYFKGDTLNFLKNLNLKIDKEYRPEFAYFEGLVATEEVLNFEDIEDKRQISEFEVDPLKEEDASSLKEEEEVSNNVGNVAFLVSEAIGKWKRTRENAKMWHPRLVHAVAKKLRHDLNLKPSPEDMALAKQDVIYHHNSDSDDSDFDEFGKPKWEVIKRREIAQRNADFDVELDMTRIPKKGHIPGYVDDTEMKQNEKVLATKVKAKKRKRNYREIGKVAIRRQLFTRGHFRRHSRLLTTECGEKCERPKRLEFHYRTDDSFHHYIVTLVGSTWFRSMIIIIILLNAVVLTIEPLESMREYPLVWKVIDEIFLAVYLTEALLKIYAHPLGYWKSGFNVFDFCILVVSLVKMINDWLDVADIGFLRVLLIVRALRILRGISLSIQLQVLVAALAQTVRTHVLSVVLLLVLLLYIAAIVSYYLFAEKSLILERSWGFVPFGMLRMIVFVTMDGWTEILEEFEQSGLLLIGRIFNLICIVLGNFMFSNIFIAIIIMNISEATDLYRERMKREKQEIVRRKKENVFRRQKLDMRQLLARQKKSPSADFYHLGEQFLKLLRHDDMVKMTDICTSPLWIDALYKTTLRTQHTSVVLMNLHRLMADNMMDLHRLYSRGKIQVKSIRRGRYNRYMRVKAKLVLLKKEILKLRNDSPKQKLRIRLPTGGTE